MESATPRLTRQQKSMHPDDLARQLAHQRRQVRDSTMQSALCILADNIEGLGFDILEGFCCAPGNRCRGCSEKRY